MTSTHTKPGTVELTIERIVAGGFGLARSAEGTVLVRGALPGERVTARPVRQSGALRAHVIEILEPHPDRLDTTMPPGADLPLAYSAQLPIKESLVREALERIANIDTAVEQIRPSPRVSGYRTAAQYTALPGGGLAARAAGSDRAVPLQSDPLVSEQIARAFDVCAARALNTIDEIAFRASIHEDRVLVGLLGKKQPPDRVARALIDAGIDGVVWGRSGDRGRFRNEVRALDGAERLLEDFGAVLATVTVQSFAQVNPLSAGMLYREAAELAGHGARALDLYAGSGVLAFHIADRFDETIAVEISADAVKRGRADARRLKSNVTFHRGDARAASRFLPADVVVMDPPRAGLSGAVLDVLIEHRPPRIVYVSCDPSTWARDVGRLRDHGYELTTVRPFDFYPFTHHVEVLSELRLLS